METSNQDARWLWHGPSTEHGRATALRRTCPRRAARLRDRRRSSLQGHSDASESLRSDRAGGPQRRVPGRGDASVPDGSLRRIDADHAVPSIALLAGGRLGMAAAEDPLPVDEEKGHEHASRPTIDADRRGDGGDTGNGVREAGRRRRHRRPKSTWRRSSSRTCRSISIWSARPRDFRTSTSARGSKASSRR